MLYHLSDCHYHTCTTLFQFETETVPECTLDCKNNGVCFLGLPSETAPTQTHRWSLDVDEHMTCLCPPGFGGRFCEAPVEQCGNGEGHVCLNGGKCVTTTSVENTDGMVRSQHHCDCTVASNEKNDRFAGKFCEHKATSICSENDWGLFCTQVSPKKLAVAFQTTHSYRNQTAKFP